MTAVVLPVSRSSSSSPVAPSAAGGVRQVGQVGHVGRTRSRRHSSSTGSPVPSTSRSTSAATVSNADSDPRSGVGEVESEPWAGAAGRTRPVHRTGHRVTRPTARDGAVAPHGAADGDRLDRPVVERRCQAQDGSSRTDVVERGHVPRQDGRVAPVPVDPQRRTEQPTPEGADDSCGQHDGVPQVTGAHDHRVDLRRLRRARLPRAGASCHRSARTVLSRCRRLGRIGRRTAGSPAAETVRVDDL